MDELIERLCCGKKATHKDKGRRSYAGQVFNFAVAVGMRLVRRLIRNTDREIDHAGPYEVGTGVYEFGQHAGASRHNADYELEQHEHGVRREGPPCRGALFQVVFHLL